MASSSVNEHKITRGKLEVQVDAAVKACNDPRNYKYTPTAGLPELRIHDLRHSFASFLVNAGQSLYTVAKILGHAQLLTD